MLLQIPIIPTKRLCLTNFQPQHFEPLVKMHTDPDVMRYIRDGKPDDRVSAWNTMALMIGHWQLRGFGLWAIEEQKTNDFVGWVGFFYPEGRSVVDFGWRLLPPFWGQGYATEAGEAAQKYASSHWKLPKVTSIIHPDNVASIKVAKKLGAIYEKNIDFFGRENAQYSYPALNDRE